MRHLLTFAAATSLVAAPAQASQLKSLIDAWDKDRAAMEADGLTEGLYLLSSIIIEGQYFAGYCSRHLSDNAFKELQPLSELQVKDGPLLTKLTELGNEQLRDGIRDAAAKPPSEELCARVLDDFFKDQRDVVRYVQASPD